MSPNEVCFDCGCELIEAHAIEHDGLLQYVCPECWADRLESLMEAGS